MRYEAPTTLDDAARLLAAESGRARALAGGTDLLVQLRSGILEPDIIVDLKRIDGMLDIRDEGGGFRIGACVPSAMMSEHPDLGRLWPGVVEAMALVGSTQIQSRATLAGNLCNASPAADSVPALAAADATVRVFGPDGSSRDAPVLEIATGPGQTSLGAGEFVGSVFLPPRPARAADAYLRFIPRTEMDIAVVGAGVSVVLDDSGACSSARVSLGAVAPTVILVEEAANRLVGTNGGDAALAALADACSAASKPIDDKRGTVAFRRRVAGVLARRAARIAFERAEARG